MTVAEVVITELTVHLVLFGAAVLAASFATVYLVYRLVKVCPASLLTFLVVLSVTANIVGGRIFYHSLSDLSSLRIRFGRQSGLIQDLRLSIDQKNSRLAGTESTLAEMNQAITEKDATIRNVSADLAQTRQKLESVAARNAELARVLGEKDAAFQSTVDSLSEIKERSGRAHV